MSITLRKAIVGLGMAALFGVTAACGTSAAKAPTVKVPAQSQPTSQEPSHDAKSAQNMSLGQTATLTDNSTGDSWDVTVNSVEHWTPTNEFDEPAGRGMHYVIVNVTYSATSGTVHANPFDWKVLDASGHAGDSEMVTLDNQLNATDVPAGSHVDGDMVFKITDGAGFTLSYSAGLMETDASWTIPVGQA